MTPPYTPGDCWSALEVALRPFVEVTTKPVLRKLRGAPEFSCESMRTVTSLPANDTPSVAENEVSSPGEASLGMVQPISWPAKRENRGHFTQSVAHLPFTSGVQATERPSPYCHCARMGSPEGDLMISSALGLRVAPL